ncbi:MULTISPECIES: ATP-binding protein DrrA1-3 family domain-containing protein [unclassified Pseudarthrobacter]|uniref:ATP-binding protein DrrA1-3 family domain-containing protein n=1 Tax=unclassified Pseudarthrobacter TaxID=2647000 RepID=UPI003FA76BD0
METLCSKVTIIRQGHAVQTGTLAELRHLSRTAVTVISDGDATSVGSLPGVHDVHRDGERVLFTVDEAALSSAMAHLLPLGVRSFTSTPPTLEELFVHHYGNGVRTAAGVEQP